ncbi:sulfurtransferase TusA family protein [Pectinatus frisingensis]|jgi:TusA-related sulfurtransferase|uniref:sulfurtransferase TusA family protein n=1 Tax=Pectinatus frisingensis TaxID=865 RepID=UPI0018C601AA|nr:sulfurtransferase TusA family protein [Pectinatus frisingensis]
MSEYTLDCLGEICPVPLIKTQKKLAALNKNDILIVSIDHSCAMKNIPEWVRKEGHNVEIEEINDGEWEIYIEK